MPVTVKIKREQGANARPGMRPPGWVYSYTTPVDVNYGARRGPRAGEYIVYGKGLAGLRDMLRRKHGRGVTLIETWK
jgi:hypothetical protein